MQFCMSRRAQIDCQVCCNYLVSDLEIEADKAYICRVNYASQVSLLILNQMTWLINDFDALCCSFWLPCDHKRSRASNWYWWHITYTDQNPDQLLAKVELSHRSYAMRHLWCRLSLGNLRLAYWSWRSILRTVFETSKSSSLVLFLTPGTRGEFSYT